MPLSNPEQKFYILLNPEVNPRVATDFSPRKSTAFDLVGALPDPTTKLHQANPIACAEQLKERPRLRWRLRDRYALPYSGATQPASSRR